MDFGHLEKMGRELKCPICLSLLKSAVSLTCNHVFCNSCIVESMRSVCNCPVCKVPFQRREVRAAPHMDNLVSIYKSMEFASGLNILATQVSPSNNSEKPLQAAYDKEAKAPESVLLPQESSGGKRTSKGKRKKMAKADLTTSILCPQTRPSFSSNKRIHVTPYPVSETPIPPKRISKLEASTNKDMDKIESENNTKLVCMRPGELTLQPFFWLKEVNEEDEGLEQETTQEMTSLTTPTNAPCFSDIKDSDDHSTPKKMTLTSTSKYTAQEAFDSEMFEWTQRACSPELFSTPLKKQKTGGKRFKGIQEDTSREISSGINNYSLSIESSKSFHLDKNPKAEIITCKSNRALKKRRKQNKGKKLDASSYEKITSISLNEDHSFGSFEIVEDSSKEKDSPKQKYPLRSTRYKKSCKSSVLHARNNMGSCSGKFKALAVAPKLLPVKSGEEILTEGMEGTSSLNLAKLSHGKSTEVTKSADVLIKCLKRTKKTFKSPKQTKRLILNCTDLKTSDEKAKTRLHLVCCKKNRGENSSKKQSTVDQNSQIGVLKQAKLKMPDMQNINDLPEHASHKKHRSTNNVVQDNQPCVTVLRRCVLSKAKELLPSTVNDVLRNYKNDQLSISCAFCHSSKDSEVSGEIMHYCDGKSVPVDYQGGVNVIHSHKNCTEWAPDVYFKDDYALNLSTELARSRRISCSCCGSKGAALGCFEKSCRRSFHYPCAKQTPDCRWDIENFVMLCPLHSSSKLPSEMSEVEKLNRKISASKGWVQPLVRKVSSPSQFKVADDKSCMWAWPAGLPCKWVLCSSGLSDAEKEILSEFVRLTGITISKAWSLAVTHVITSTEENGACKRTLKILMGILDGKWILSIEWIKACMKSKKPVDEKRYEITVDVHGVQNGPRLGRMRAINKEPKLFSGFWFYLFGEFLPSYKSFLQDLITAATGKVLQRRPIAREFAEMLNCSSGTTLIVYSLKLPENSHNQDAKLIEHRKAEAIALAEECRAMAVADSWILDSIAASSLQVLPM